MSCPANCTYVLPTGVAEASKIEHVDGLPVNGRVDEMPALGTGGANGTVTTEFHSHIKQILCNLLTLTLHLLVPSGLLLSYGGAKAELPACASEHGLDLNILA